MKGWSGMNTRVHGFMEAFAKEGIPSYAPRAGRFLEVEETPAPAIANSRTGSLPARIARRN